VLLEVIPGLLLYSSIHLIIIIVEISTKYCGSSIQGLRLFEARIAFASV